MSMTKLTISHHGHREEEPAAAEIWWYVAITGMIIAILTTGLVVLGHAGVFHAIG